MSRPVARRLRSWQSQDANSIEYSDMKHVSAYTDLQSCWTKYFAWLPKRSNGNDKFIWLTSYYEYAITMDMNGAVPIKGTAWRMIYTREEYITKKLQGDMNE